MAYFPNGTSAEAFERQCEECINGLSDDVLCPVYFVQYHFNYQQCDNQHLAECLAGLVDRNGVCQMKVAIDAVFKTEPDDISDLEAWERSRNGIRG